MSRESNQCAGKVQYPNFEAGHSACENLNKRGKRKLTAYKCPDCDFFHLGHGQRINRSKGPKNVDYKKYDHQSKSHTANKRFIKNK